MKITQTIQRYLVILEELQTGPVPKADLLGRIQKRGEALGYDLSISQRQLERDRNDIQTLFDLDIEMDRKSRAYYLPEKYQPGITEKLLEQMAFFFSVRKAHPVDEYIHFDKRESQGNQYLTELANAIRNQRILDIGYQKFESDEEKKHTFYPLALKQFRVRWYLIGQIKGKDFLTVLGLDRMKNLIVTDALFNRMECLPVSAILHDSFGIIDTGEAPERIEFEVRNRQAEYLKSQPIHQSQKLLKKGPDWTRFKLKLQITHHLKQELLSLIPNIKIVHPPSLMEEFQSILLEAINLQQTPQSPNGEQIQVPQPPDVKGPPAPEVGANTSTIS